VLPALTVLNALRETKARQVPRTSDKISASAPESNRTGVEALFVGEDDGMERELVTREQVPFTAITAGAVNGVGPVKAVKGVVRMLRGVVDAHRVIGRFNPDVVLLTGGFVGVPVAVAARLRNTPSVVYLPDIEPGMALKLMARFCTKVATTTEDSAAYIDQRKMVVTGYPVREAFAGLTRAAARAQLNLPDDARVLLVFGGSKGAQSINRAVVAGIGTLLEQAFVVQVTGAGSWDEVAAAHAAQPDAARARWRIHKYLHEEMAAALTAADLAVCRSGASALGELPYVGLPAVLVPYPYAWRYQKVNADYLVKHGAARRLDDGALASELVPTVAALLRDTVTLDNMGAAARKLGRRDGAQRIAQVLMECSHD
jgi:UDP-N-acetylglucosamine--N-acetylmuramyl-(pentapeptide) pyrophosphoryl-undecaprenol N-acetylglucosamine transferase